MLYHFAVTTARIFRGLANTTLAKVQTAATPQPQPQQQNTIAKEVGTPRRSNLLDWAGAGWAPAGNFAFLILRPPAPTTPIGSLIQKLAPRGTPTSTQTQTQTDRRLQPHTARHNYTQRYLRFADTCGCDTLFPREPTSKYPTDIYTLHWLGPAEILKSRRNAAEIPKTDFQA